MVVTNVKVCCGLSHFYKKIDEINFLSPVLVKKCTAENDGEQRDANNSCSVCTCKVRY